MMYKESAEGAKGLEGTKESKDEGTHTLDDFNLYVRIAREL